MLESADLNTLTPIRGDEPTLRAAEESEGLMEKRAFTPVHKRDDKARARHGAGYIGTSLSVYMGLIDEVTANVLC